MSELTDPAADPVCFLSVAELTQAYAARKLSPVEVTQRMLDRIARLNLQLRAYYQVDAEGAQEAARQSEARWMSRAPLGPLDGVPVSIKDHIDVYGLKNVRGGPLAAAQPSTFDSPPSARLREGGAVILGKTTMPELSVIPDTATRAHGITRNPVAPAHSPGGSSGGAAAAVAAGMCTIAIGSDGGGSIRLPASFTGTVGHKPTHGRVPYFPGQTDRTVAGPIARSAADCAVAMNVIARPDGRDWMELPADGVDYVRALDSVDLAGVRIAYSADYGYQRVDAEVASAVERMVERLAGQGARVQRIGRICADPFRIYMIQAALRLRSTPRASGAPLAISSVLDFAATLTPEDQQRMIDERNALGRDLLAVFREADVLISPTSPVPAPLVGEFYPDGDTMGEANRNLIGFTCPVNLVHMPAISVPCGVTRAGLPVGLQIAGPKFSDAKLIAVAGALEKLGEP